MAITKLSEQPEGETFRNYLHSPLFLFTHWTVVVVTRTPSTYDTADLYFKQKSNKIKLPFALSWQRHLSPFLHITTLFSRHTNRSGPLNMPCCNLDQYLLFLSSLYAQFISYLLPHNKLCILHVLKITLFPWDDAKLLLWSWDNNFKRVHVCMLHWKRVILFYPTLKPGARIVTDWKCFALHHPNVTFKPTRVLRGMWRPFFM